MNRLSLAPIPITVTFRWRDYPRRCVAFFEGRALAVAPTYSAAKDAASVFFREEYRLSGRKYSVTWEKEPSAMI